MILQALNDYYQRKTSDPNGGLAPFGFEWKEIPFIIVLTDDGHVVQIEDTREGDGKKKQARSFLVPQGAKKSVNIAANMLWGNAEYVLGLPDIKKLAIKQSEGKEADYEERLQTMEKAFRDQLDKLPDAAKLDRGVRAVLAFYSDSHIDDLSQFEDKWQEIGTSNPNLTFRLNNDGCLICQRDAVVSAISQEACDVPTPHGVCLITGKTEQFERLHPSIKGVWGAQTAGANIVSFNLSAFNSYGKEQGANAPVGKTAAFAYTTALNHLLAKGSRQRLQVGDASTVFWADRPHEMETLVVDAFGEPPEDDSDRNVRAVESLYRSVQSGGFAPDDAETRFFVLGLSPNAARIAIRFWHTATVTELARVIRRHFDDLEIVPDRKDAPRYLSLFRLLVNTAVQGKADNIPPNLAGDVMRAILSGRPYPDSLLTAAIRRIRVERHVNHPRAALIKACLNRGNRFTESKKEVIQVALDTSNTSSAYRLGRLFAVLEKIQEEANPGINATIRDRFYGAASGTPSAVFPTLLKLKNHHVAKLDNRGRAVNLEKLIGEIVDGLADFPAQLGLQDQGRFAVGYYHQRQAFFTKHESE